MRVIRVMRLFHQLRVLVLSIAYSMGALIWSIVFLSVLQAIAAIGMTQVLHSFIVNSENDPAVQRSVYNYFGRWSYSCLTMFEITLVPGSLTKIGRLISDEVSALYWVFFVTFGWGVTFAIVRVISAIFLKQTLSAASG